MTLKILAMGGDSIGPVVVDPALKALEVTAKSIKLGVEPGKDLLHGAAWEKHRSFIHQKTLKKARTVARQRNRYRRKPHY